MLGDEEKEGYVDWGDAVRDPDGLGGESEDDDDNDDVDTVDEETSGNALCAPGLYITRPQNETVTPRSPGRLPRLAAIRSIHASRRY